jgi:signal transduction histidine kinase
MKEEELSNKATEYEYLLKALKESQEKLEYDSLKTEFFSNISHEFKTPLNIIMGAMQLIDLYTVNGAIKDPEGKLGKYLNVMMQNSRRLLKLINNIIDLTRIDSSYLDIELRNHNVVAIVDNIIQSISLYAREKCINIVYTKEVSEKVIACDEDKLERILLNLLSNALKFTGDKGNIEVVLGVKEDKVFISVTDNGIGIPKDKQQVIFQRFRQVDKSFTRNREGSGIGLSIVKALVEMHKGSISLQSEYGKGSKFTVELPVILVQKEKVHSLNSQFENRIEERVKIEFSDL